MKVVHLSRSDLRVGAAISTYRTHRALLDCGVQSTMFVRKKYSGDASVVEFRPGKTLSNRIRRYLRRKRLDYSFGRFQKYRPTGWAGMNDERSMFGQDSIEQLPAADLIHLHWVPKFVDHGKLFASVPHNTPIIWTLHDMNPFTGGCHYDLDCGRFQSQCGSCPLLQSQDPHDPTYHIWRRKLKALERIDARQLHIITPSQWMAEMAGRSSLLGRFPRTVVPNGVDTEEFRPCGRQEARAILEIPQDARVVLFVAHLLSDVRKGFSHLIDAIRGLTELSDLHLLSVGAGQQVPDIATPHKHLGYLSDVRSLSLAYSAADIFVIPSLQENFGNTVLESLACGTPVVGFDVGGIPDMVRPGITGALARVGDTAALRDSIKQMLENRGALDEMSQKCRQIAVEKYDIKQHVKRYLAVCRQMLGIAGTGESLDGSPADRSLAST